MRELVAVSVLMVAACGGTSPSTAPPSSEAAAVTATTSPPTAATVTTSPGTTSTITATSTSSTTTSTTTTTLPPDPLLGLGLELISDELRQPTAIANAPGDDALYVAERTGGIARIDDGVTTSWAALPVNSVGIEQGLLGLAFAPDGSLVVYYTTGDDGRRLSRFPVTADGLDVDGEQVLFDWPQPDGSADIRHYAGDLAFGPDGLLYVASGDGADFVNASAQDRDSPYGAILRIELTDDGYAIPAANPYQSGGAPEVLHTGLRNPWRFTIDGDRLIIGDVGFESREEIDVVLLDEAGIDFGWPVMEGSVCFDDPDCDPTPHRLPVHEYRHGDEGACSITGGEVYRGIAIPELHGHYFYGDWCGGWIRSLVIDGAEATDAREWPELRGAGGSQWNTFGTDAGGELLVAAYSGELYRIVPVRQPADD